MKLFIIGSLLGGAIVGLVHGWLVAIIAVCVAIIILGLVRLLH